MSPVIYYQRLPVKLEANNVPPMVRLDKVKEIIETIIDKTNNIENQTRSASTPIRLLTDNLSLITYQEPANSGQKKNLVTVDRGFTKTEASPGSQQQQPTSISSSLEDAELEEFLVQLENGEYPWNNRTDLGEETTNSSHGWRNYKIPKISETDGGEEVPMSVRERLNYTVKIKALLK